MATKHSKYDNITCKQLIQSDQEDPSPAFYQLTPTEEQVGTLTRKTLGQRKPNTKNKSILLVGETGTGKSTLINALVNYTMGVQWEDNIWFRIVEEGQKRPSGSEVLAMAADGEKISQAESQTSDVIVYRIFGFEGKTLPYSLTIIDTPGYGDTRGIEKDEIISQRLLDLFQTDDGVQEIHAVGLVLKASDNRLSDRLRYIFNSVMSLFGKDMETNIVILATHSDGVVPENVLKALQDANIKCAKDEEDEPRLFMFNNRQTTQRTKKTRVALKCAWDLTMDQIGELTNFLNNTSSQNLEKSAEVLDRQITLTSCVQSLKQRIVFIELKQREIQQEQEALKMHKEAIENNKDFTEWVDEPYKDKERISGGFYFFGLLFKGAVCCTVCEENCHYPGCTRAWTAEGCEVMKDDSCTVCKCQASCHVKEEWIYVIKTRKVKRTLQDMKDKYMKSKKDKEKSKSLLETLQTRMEELQKEKDELVEESFQHVVRLEQIALNVNSLSTHENVDFLLQKMKEKKYTQKVRKLEEIKRRMDSNKGIMAGMRYRLTTGVKQQKH